MVFVELPLFTRYASFTDEELLAVQVTLLRNPAAGALIPGGRGLRKLRAGQGGRGKRGGARVIYYWWRPRSRCYLVFAYPKTAQADLTRRQLRELAAVMDEEVGNG